MRTIQGEILRHGLSDKEKKMATIWTTQDMVIAMEDTTVIARTMVQHSF